ncbi:MAG: class I SAM-dependent methyltransferase [Planctomycetota bacterium]
MIRKLGAFPAVALAVAAARGAVQKAAQEDLPAPPVPLYEYRALHDPNGIGKFYLGREIAHVMGAGAIPWLERPEREREEDPARLLEALKLREGEVVADVGAGSGYHTFRIAPFVGTRGRVFAVDVQPEMVRVLRQKARASGASNVEVVHGDPRDPKLPEGAVHLVLLVDVYHEFAWPYEMMRALRRALRPGGRVVLVEFRKEDPRVPIKEVHKMSEEQIRREMAAVGLRWRQTVGTLPWQHAVFFEKER